MSKQNAPLTDKLQTKSLRCTLGWIALFAMLLLSIAMSICAISLHRITTAKIATLAQTFERSVQRSNARIDALRQQLSNQQSQMETLLKNSPNHSQRWRVENGLLMVRLAHYQLNVFHNIPVAIRLLNASLSELHSLNGNTAFRVKQSLTHYLNQLKTYPNLDQESLIHQLNSLSLQIDQLTISAPSIKKKTMAPAPVFHHNAPNWQHHLEKTWHEFKSMIVIRHLDHPVTPLTAPNQQAYLLQHLHLQLQQAQWAILNRNQVLYLDALNQFETQLTNYFVVNTAVARHLQSMLLTLKKINVAPEVPDLAPILKAFNHLRRALN